MIGDAFKILGHGQHIQPSGRYLQGGRTRGEFAESLRSSPVGKYVIFYRAMQDGIEVVRVLSGFRDIPNVFTAD